MYLKKHNVMDWLQVIASNKDRNVYKLRYFNIANHNEGDEEDLSYCSSNMDYLKQAL